MTFGEDLAWGVGQLREHAESAMVDKVLVETVIGETLNADNQVVPEWGMVYAGRCRVIPTDFKDFDKTAGEASFDAADAKIAMPITADTAVGDTGDPAAIRNGDRATITSVDPSIGDPANVGRVMTLQRDPDRTHTIERRFAAVEVS